MIRGERVTLRAMQPADYPRLVEFGNDADSAALSSIGPVRPITLATIVKQQDERALLPNRVGFAIEADGVFIGDCGLFDIDRLHGTAQLGIGIGDRSCWSRGYGRDSVSILVRYAFTTQNLRKVCLGVLATNERAIRCYRATGFVEEGRLRQHVWSAGQYVDEVLMALLREDWLVYQRPARRPRHLNVTDDSDD